MRVPQDEIRESMIECFAIKLDDIGVAPLVIGVAMVAVLLNGIRLTAMKPLIRRTIGGNFLVAC